MLGESGAAKYRAHHLDEADDSFVVNEIKNPIGILFVVENAFVSQNGQMLGNIALGGAHLIDDLLHADRLVAENAKDFQP